MFKILLMLPLLLFDSTGKPVAESYPDEKGQIVYSKVYNYTKDGKIRQETEYGNLTGGNFDPILLDENGLPKPDQTCDQYTLRYRYSENKMSTTDEKGAELKTVYKANFTLPEAQYFYNSVGDLIQRWFYQYDSSGSLVEWMTDNGISEKRNILDGVSKRTIFRLNENTIEEWAIEGKKEVLKQRVVRSLENHVSKTEFFDSEGKSLGWVEHLSDEQGRLKEERDSAGNITTYEYDGPDQVTQKIGEVSIEFRKKILSKVTYKTEEGNEKSLQWEYYPDGHLAFFVDEEGNKTEYLWDGNDLTQIDPLVNDERDIPYHPTWKYCYDSFGNLKSFISPKGETTSYTYTSRGQPAQIIFSDGTTEMLKYDPEGTLHRHRFQNGKTVVYEYNDYGEVQYKEIYGRSLKSPSDYLGGVRFDNEQKSVKWTSHHTNSPLLLKYDQGYLKLLNHEEKPLISWNHEEPSTRNVYYGNGPNDFWIENGNQIFSHNGLLLCDTTATLNRKSPNIYKEILDVRGRIKKREHPLRSIEYSYDRHDNLAREKYVRIPNEGLSSYFIIGYDWGPNDRLKEYWLQQTENKIGYQYNSYGNVKTKSFDSKVLNYQYDAYGNLSKIYTKDPNQPISTYEFYKDVELATTFSGIEIERQFSPIGYLLSERTSSPHSSTLNLRYKRDLQGRITRIELPDRTFIEYGYNGPFVASIRRLNSEKTELYSHSITKRNLQGCIEEETLIGIIGNRTHQWTNEGKLNSIQTALFSQVISFDRTLVETRDPVSSFTTHYAYDALCRLIEEEGIFNHTFTYDSLDNCIRKDGVSVNINDLNQIINLETLYCEYNSIGDLLTKNKALTFYYNVFNQPNRIDFNQANQILYRYDAHSRWLERQVNEPNNEEEGDESIPSVQSFLYLDRTPIGVIDENGTLSALRIPLDPQHPERSPAIAIELNGKPFAPIYDLFGNLTLLLDPNTAAVSESYRFSAFGEEALFDEHQQPIQKSKLANPWRYRDRYKDDETGLIYFDLRFYDPSLMRWITPDLLGPIDGPNLYAFLRNNPIGHHDYSGLTTDTFSEYFYGEYESHCYCEEHRQCKRGGSIQSLAAGIAIGFNDFSLSILEPIAQIGTRINIADLDCTPLEREALLVIADESRLRLRENLKFGIENLFDVNPSDEVAEKYAQRTLLTLQVADFLRGNVRDPRKILSFAKTHCLEKAGSTVEIAKKIRANPIWTSTRKMSSVQNAFQHWKDHKLDFPMLKNSKEYAEATRNFLKNPTPETIVKIRPNGDRILFDPTSNTFAIANKEGVPRTMYKPNPSFHGYKSNLDYFYDQ